MQRVLISPTDQLLVSRPGQSVFGGELMFDSNLNFYRIRETYNIILVGSSSPSVATVNHNFGTVPLAIRGAGDGSSITNPGAYSLFNTFSMATSSTQVIIKSEKSIGSGNSLAFLVHLFTEYI